MANCPNCGINNSESRVFCAVCGTRLREDDPPQAAAPPFAGTGPLLPSWLTGATGEHAAKKPLPAWLEGAPVQPETAEAPQATPPIAPEPPRTAPKAAEAWDDGLDFSDLPEWEPDPTRPPFPTPREQAEQPMGAAETAGLLAGVTGAIPIEPMIRDPRRSAVPQVPPPEDALYEENSEAAAIFAGIAGGAVRPEPVTLPRSAGHGAGLFNLLLLFAVIGGVALKAAGWTLFDPPPMSPAALDFAGTIDALPASPSVLVAVEYDGALMDELTPPLAATLHHVAEAAPEARLIVASSSPLGAALVAMAMDGGTTLTTEVVGYLPGGSTGQRALLSRVPADLTLVVAGDGTAARSWIEQVSLAAPERPLLLIAPASAEAVTRPYLASGQVDGALATVAETAAYELSRAPEGGAAWGRLDAVTLASLVLLTAMLAGFARGTR